MKQDNTYYFLAAVLIFVGLIWLLNEVVLIFDLKYYLQNLFEPIQHIVRWLARIVFSWQLILIVIGSLLLVRRKSIGYVLVVIGVIFIVPKIFMWESLSFSLVFPMLLIGVGITFLYKVNLDKKKKHPYNTGSVDENDIV